MIIDSQPLAQDQQTIINKTFTLVLQWTHSLMHQRDNGIFRHFDLWWIIESIPLSRMQLDDIDGWNFRNNGKYTVKSGYQVERVYPDREKPPTEYGPTINSLKAFC